MQLSGGAAVRVRVYLFSRRARGWLEESAVVRADGRLILKRRGVCGNALCLTYILKGNRTLAAQWVLGLTAATLKKTLVIYPNGRLIIHISTFLVVTLAVLSARHLSFAAPALLIDAATFTRTLEERETG